MERQSYRVGVLGATGLVGRRLVSRLSRHPWFELIAVAASDRSAGRAYGDVVPGRLGSIPGAGTRRCSVDSRADRLESRGSFSN